MASIIIPSRWTAQPSGPVEVDWGHPHNRGLLGWWTFNDGRFRDISGLNRNVTLFGSGPHFANTPVGVAYANNGTASKYISAPLSYPAIGTGPWAGEIVFSINAFKNYNGLMFAESGSTTYYDIDFYSNSGGTVGIHRDWYSRAISAGRFHHYLVTRTGTGAGNGASYLNGVRATHNFVEDMNTAFTAVLFGTYGGSSDWLNGAVLYGRLLNRHVTPDEAAERYAAWWGPLKGSPRSKVFIGLAASGETATAVSSDFTTTYGISGVVNASYSPSYNILSAVNASFAPTYSILSAVGEQIAPTYTVYQAVGTSLAPAYVIAAAVGQQLAPAYGIQEAVGASLAPSYALLATSSQYGRPTSTSLAGSWLPFGAESLHEAVNEEEVSDAEYAYSSAFDDEFEQVLSPLTTPADGPVRVRVRVPAGFSPNIPLTVRLMQGATQRAAWTIDPVIPNVTNVFTLTQGERDSIGDWADLRVRVRTAAAA